MNNILEYLVATIIVLAIAFYACTQLNHLLLDVLNRVASMITGGF